MEMIKKLLILSGILILIGGIGTIFTMINSNQNKEIISIPTMKNSKASTLIEQLEIQYTNSNGKTFDEFFTLQTTEDSILIKEKRRSNIQFFSPHFSSNLSIQGNSKHMKKIEIELVTTTLALTDLEADEIILSSVSGDLDLTNVSARSIYLEATSGDIELIETAGELELSAVSGDIKLKNTKLTHSIQGSTVSGDIKLYFTEQPTDVHFKGKTVSGDVSFLNDNINSIKIGEPLLTIDLDTVSGDITVE